MLLPMLCIYQEYVRNHHFSLQVLAECKQREKFAGMLRRLEEKPLLQGLLFLIYSLSLICSNESLLTHSFLFIKLNVLIKQLLNHFKNSQNYLFSDSFEI